jgi:hypothetical protein
VTSELKPLIDDTSSPATIRDLLRQARSANTPQYDFDAGLIKHKALITSGAPLPEWANSSLTGVTKTTTLIARIVGIASVPIVGGVIAWNAFIASGGEYRSDNTEPIQVAETRQQQLKISAADAVQSTTDPAKPGSATEDIKSRSTASMPEQKDRTITRKESLARPPRKRLDRRTPVEATARPQIATVQVAEKESNGEPTTDGLNHIEFASIRFADDRVASSTFGNEPKTKARPPTDDTLQREMKRLAEARRLVDVSPLRSLALARAQYPKTGILAEEWDQVDLLALIKLGRIEEAKKGVKRFRNRYPNSAFNERLSKELMPSR